MRRVLAVFLLIAASIATAPTRVWAASGEADMLTARIADAVAAMQGSKPAREVFSEAFLAAVPEAQFARLAAELQVANGKLAGFEGVRPIAPTQARFVIRFERAIAEAGIQIDSSEPYKVAGFRIELVTPLNDGPQKLVADFAALPGRSGFALARLGESGPAPVLTYRPAGQFAIGSAFKLWVLDALAGEIEAGNLRWDQVVPLGPPSLPSGQTQNWPPSAPLTVHTLAALMISISDNTATDTLIRLIGRDRIEAAVAASGHSEPARLRPFPTTAEAFALKAGPASEASRYAAADEAGKRRMLAGLPVGWPPGAERDAMLAALATNQPLAIAEVEWFASPDDVVRVLDRLRRRKDPRVAEILAVAPHLPESLKGHFAYAGYKGGSEPGVIALNWLLRSKSGEWFAVSASWNNAGAAIDNARFEGLAQRLIGLIR